MEDSILVNQLEVFEKIIKYLDVSGNLAIIKAQCHKSVKNKNRVFMFKLLVDPLEFAELDAHLGNLLLREPQNVAGIFNQVVYKVVQALNLLSDDVCPSQISVILRLTTLPIVQIVSSIQGVRCKSQAGGDVGMFCRLKGMVIGLSAPSKYTQSTRYYCPDEDCSGFHGNSYIRIHTAGASEAQTVRKDFKCTICQSTLAEEKSSRILSEKLVAEVVTEKVIIQSHQQGTTRTQAIPVYIRDDLTKVVEIGECYDIIGLPKTDIQDDRITLAIEANNIQKVKSEISTKTLLKQIPRDVLELYKDRQSSPWSFVLTLAYLFAGDIAPPGSYFNLKLAILLSLMSKYDNKSQPLHLLVVGQDIEMVCRLLQFGQRFAGTATSLTTGHTLAGHVTQDKYRSAQYFVEGGVLHLSQRGVCYIGDVNRLKKNTKQQLHTVLSGGKILTDVGSKFTGGLPHYLEQPLRSRVWAYSDITTSRTTQQPADQLFVAQQVGDVPKPLIESFSFLCFTNSRESWSTQEVDNDMMMMTLTTAVCGANDDSQKPPISSQDLQQFVRFASRLRPKYSKEAETLIHSYYLSSRKSRSTPGRTDVPVNADQTILSLAYSHAKLALRTEVGINDAVMAIRIYEESLTLRFGYSTLCVQPLLHISKDSLGQCLGPENDEQMRKFHTNLLKYCSLASGFEE